jgi:hypothetical protein
MCGQWLDLMLANDDIVQARRRCETVDFSTTSSCSTARTCARFRCSASSGDATPGGWQVATDSIPAPVRRILSYVVVSFGLLALLISGTGLIMYAIVQHLSASCRG